MPTETPRGLSQPTGSDMFETRIADVATAVSARLDAALEPMAGQIGAAQLLVIAGADVSLTVPAASGDIGGPYRSPLSEAVRHEQAAMTDWLLERGASHHPPETN